MKNLSPILVGYTASASKFNPIDYTWQFKKSKNLGLNLKHVLSVSRPNPVARAPRQILVTGGAG